MKALDIVHGLEKFHNYCFTRETGIITNTKPLTTIFKTDEVTPSQRLQSILLRIHQYTARINNKPGPDLFIANWLSRECY